MVTIINKFINKPGLIKIYELPIGKFGSINGTIVYRIRPHGPDTLTYLPGLLFIEHHNHLTIWDANKEDSATGHWTHMCELIEKPAKKHCDNAIAILKKMGKEGKIDGLVYVDHLSTLKSYIKDYLDERRA